MSNKPSTENRPLQQQAKWLETYQPGLRIHEQGAVVSVGDGIAWIAGLPSAAMDDVLIFADGSRGMVFDLNEDMIGAVLLSETDALTSGTTVQRSGRTLSIPVGDGLLGRVVDPLGNPLDGGEPPAHSRWQPLEAKSPPIIARDFVHRPLYSGIKISIRKKKYQHDKKDIKFPRLRKDAHKYGEE